MRASSFGILFFSLSAHAQYQLPPDVNFIETRPQQYQECDKREYEVSVAVLKICQDSVYNAERLADRYGGGWGEIQGYLHGFAQGLYQGVNSTRNDGAERDRAAAFVKQIGSFGSALKEGLAEAQRAATTDADSDVFALFDRAVGTGRLPTESTATKQKAYAGIANGFDRYGAQYGASSKTIQEILRTEIEPGLREIPIYHSRDASVLGEVTPYSIWDLWFDDGYYRFEKARWYDPEAAYHWYSNQQYADAGKPKTQELLSAQVQKGVVDGKPVYYTREELAQKFQAPAFKEAYRYYINYYFSNALRREGSKGYLHGQMVGQQTGKRVAYYEALKREFNTRFQEDSQKAFTEAYASQYREAYRKAFERYRDNPQLDFEIVRVLEDEGSADGFFEPGEKIAYEVRVINRGGVPARQNLTAGDRASSIGMEPFAIGAISQKSFSTSLMGRVDPTLAPKRDYPFTLLADGRVVASKSQRIQRQLEIEGQGVSVSVTEGRVSLKASVQNISKVPANAVSFIVYVNNKPYEQKNIGSIAPNGTYPMGLDIDGLDPLALIDGEIALKVYVYRGDLQLDELPVRTEVASPFDALIGYYDRLANQKGYVPASTDFERQIAEVQSRLVHANRENVEDHRKGRNVFKKRPYTTVIGKIVAEYEAHAQSEKANRQYATLKNALREHRARLKNFLFFGGKKRSYDRLLERLPNR